MGIIKPSSGDHREDPLSVEDQWVEAVRKGNREVFRRIFETWYNPLLRFAFRYVRSETVAEGLVQDLFLWIWEHRESWNVEGKLQTYLFRAIKYKSMDYWRQERRRRSHLISLWDENANPDNHEIGAEDFGEMENGESEFVRAAQQAIEELTDRPRLIYKMHRLEGLTYREIAEILEISPKTVEIHMGRALDYLRKRLARYLPLLLFLEFGLATL